MEELTKRKYLIITNSDRGLTVVIIYTGSASKKPISNYLTNQTTNNELKTQHYNITELSTKP